MFKSLFLYSFLPMFFVELMYKHKMSEAHLQEEAHLNNLFHEMHGSFHCMKLYKKTVNIR